VATTRSVFEALRGKRNEHLQTIVQAASASESSEHSGTPAVESPDHDLGSLDSPSGDGGNAVPRSDNVTTPDTTYDIAALRSNTPSLDQQLSNERINETEL